MRPLLFESPYVTTLLVYIPLSSRKCSEYFCQFWFEVVFLNWSIWICQNWSLALCRFSFSMGFQKCIVFVFFSKDFFCHVFNGWKPSSHWRIASQEERSSFFKVTSLCETHRFPRACWELAPWEQKLRILSNMFTEFCWKILDYR